MTRPTRSSSSRLDCRGSRSGHRARAGLRQLMDRPLRLEALEDRRLLAAVTVGNALDVVNGNTSSIAALIASNGGDGISLREAILAANATAGADAINFAPGLTGATITLGGTELAITEALAIDARPLAQNVTIDANQHSRIFNITALSGDVALGGLTLTGGRTTGDNPYGSGLTQFSGGAIRSVTGGHLTIDRSFVTGNSTTGFDAGGGGIFASDSVTLIESTISDNSTAGFNADGGGILVRGATTLTRSTVNGNSTTGNNAQGGGIFVADGGVTLTQSTVSGNSTYGEFADGGGIRADGAATLTESTVSGNSTKGFYSAGGGIFAAGGSTLNRSIVSGNSTAGNIAPGGGIVALGTLTFNQSTVSGNSTAGTNANGGGIAAYSDSVTLNHSTVSGNSTEGASADGGGILALSNLTLNRSTVSGNSTAGINAHGGGIVVSNGAATLTQSTVANNRATHATAQGGGVYQGNTVANHPLTLSGTIVAGNTAGGGGADLVRDPGGALTVNYSLIGNTTGTSITAGTGTGNILNVAAQLAPLANNGGPTQTHALLAASPALNAGDPSVATGFDQRGAPFVRVAGGRIDVGAYERQTLANPALFVVTTTADELDYTNGAVSLREAINSANGSVGAEVITFAPGLAGQTIALGGTELEITEALTIDARPLAANVTIDANQQSRIFNITATSGAFTLGGLTLTGGRTTIDSNSGNNYAGDGGAVRSLTTGLLTLDRSTIIGSSTAGYFAHGGGIGANGAVTLTRSTVSGNSTSGDGARGGGIHLHTDAFAIVTLLQSTVSGNSTAGSAAFGGGIHARSVTLTQSMVSGNSTTGNDSLGGGIFCASITAIRSTVSGNSTSGMDAHGGGIMVGFGNPSLTQSTVTNNHVAHGGGGGVFQFNWTPPPPAFVINSSIVAGNTATDSPDIRLSDNSILIVDYSLIGDTSGSGITPATGTGNVLNAPAQLASLAPNGGPTWTHAPLPGSIAVINRGDPGVAFDPNESDQRGAPFVRVANGRIDIGAYEAQTVPGLNLVVDTALDENDGDYSPGDLSLREAIGLANGSLGPNQITFAPALSSQTIALNAGELVITETLTVNALALPDNVTIDADQKSRIFNITAETGDLALRGLTMTNGRVAGGNVFPDSSFSGGAVRSHTTGQLTLERGGIFDSSTAGANAHGGGLWANGPATLVLSTVSGNSTSGGASRGGGVAANGAVTLVRSTVSGNSTSGISGSGGGIYAGADVTLDRSTVSANRTMGTLSSGGGIAASGTATLTQSTVSGNRTEGNGARGGGIWATTVALTQSTVTGNQTLHANSTGGGVYQSYSFTSQSLSLSGSIIAGNTAAGGAPDVRPHPNNDAITVNYSLIGNTSDSGITAGTGTGNVLNVAAQLAPLAPNGGPAWTHAPLAGSPAINAGDPSVAAGFDQRGAPFVRVVGGRVDVGAVERQTLPGFSLHVSTAVDENDGDYSAGDLSLREAIGLHNGGAGGGVITFAPTLAGQTIRLGGTELLVIRALAINALPLAANVTIDARQQSRIFNITAATGDFTFGGLKLTGGRTTDNGLAGTGGAVRSVTVGDLTFERSEVSGNRTSGTGARGGGIWTNGSGGGATLIHSTVSDNHTTGDFADGGGIRSLSDVTLIQSTVSGNTTSGNTARGGGIYAVDAVTISHSTITGNHVIGLNGAGGGVYQWNSPTNDHPFTIVGSIVAGNTTLGVGIDLRPDASSPLTVTHSLIGAASGLTFAPGSTGNQTGTSAAPLAPQLAPLANNGGSTRTHAPLVGSPAIDAGDPSAAAGVVGVPLHDQRGVPFGRIVGGRVDVGAFEMQTASPPSADFDDDGDVDGADFLSWQRGLGATGALATKANGNADGDNDVDAADLGVWKLQFGDSPSVAALVEPAARTEPGPPPATAAPSRGPLTPALVDAAMAWQQLSDAATPWRPLRPRLLRAR